MHDICYVICKCHTILYKYLKDLWILISWRGPGIIPWWLKADISADNYQLCSLSPAYRSIPNFSPWRTFFDTQLPLVASLQCAIDISLMKSQSTNYSFMQVFHCCSSWEWWDYYCHLSVWGISLRPHFLANRTRTGNHSECAHIWFSYPPLAQRHVTIRVR